jgi:phospholipid/cholesterol/gamma-HCH transport system substrate-binding protein
MRIDNRGWKIAGLLVFAAACSAILVLLYIGAGGKLRLHKPYQVKVQVPTAFQLVHNGDVRRAGVKVGVVDNITNQGADGLVTIELNKQTAPVYRDATVRVRTKTLVGENYLDIDPGTPQAGALPSGATLPLARAGEAVQLDQILSSLDPKTRKDVQRNLDTLGPGLRDRGESLNRLWAAAKPTARDGGTVLRVLAGQKREVAALVQDTGTVMKAFGDRAAQVRTLATQAKVTAEATASRDREFASALHELAPTVVQAQSSVDKIAGFSGRATPVVSDLAGVSRDLRPALDDLRPAAQQTRALFKELPGALRAANPLLTRLRPFSTQLSPAIESLDAFLRQANPAVGYFKPFADEIGGVFANNGSVFQTKDAVGHKGRVHAVLSASSYTGFSPAMKKAVTALIDLGAYELYDSEKVNAYPQPGSIGHPRDLEGGYPRVEAKTK